MTKPREPASPSEAVLRSSRGMTMIEVLAVVLILGLSVTVIALNLDHATPTARLHASAREIGSMLEYVRNEAIVQKRYLFLIVDVENRRYRWARAPEIGRMDEDLERDSEYSTWKSLLRSVQIEDVTWDDGAKRSDGKFWIPFNPNGMSQGVTFHLINEDGRRVSTEVNGLTGIVSVHDGYKEIDEVEDGQFE